MTSDMTSYPHNDVAVLG